MFKNKLLKYGCHSVISIIFGITMSMAFVMADTPLQSNSDFTILMINEEVRTHQGHEQAEENADEKDLQAEELEGLEEYEISISGMTCANCETKVKGALLKCSGVKTAWVSHIEGNAVIEVNEDMIDGDEIVAAIEKAGFTFIE